MPRNPYIAAWRRQERNRRATEPLAGRVLRILAAAGAVALLVPLARPVFLSFLDRDPADWDGGFEGVLVRFGLLVVAILSLDVYTALIRSHDRGVLAVLPVDPAGVVAYEVLRIAASRGWLVVAGAALLLPVGLQASWSAWALGVGVMAGCFALGLGASGLMHLLAVDVAESPRWAPLLDLLRGHNPRQQAAFIYAPGAVLAVAGGVVMLAARGADLAAQGTWPAAAALLAPPLAGALAWSRVGALAARWFAGGAIVADIDARYAALGERDEGSRVYLDWMVRWLPPRVALYALKDLRHGWRVRRTWVLGAWIAGVGAALAGWAAHGLAAANATWLAAAAVWALAGVGVVMDRDDPAFLRVWMPPPGLPGTVARFVVQLAWLQGCLWLAFFAVLVRHGGAAAGQVLATGLLSMLVAVPLARAASRLPTAGPWVYGPVAAVAVGATAAWTLTGAA